MVVKTAVIDASVAAKWFLLEPDRPAALAVQRNYELVAPELLLAETINAVWKSARSSGLDVSVIPPIVAALLPAFSRLVPLSDLLPRAGEICFDLNHPVYDCFYLALAERESCELVTADTRLLRKVKMTPFAKLVRALA